MVRHDINIDVARETVYELVGPELTGKLRRTHWQSHNGSVFWKQS